MDDKSDDSSISMIVSEEEQESIQTTTAIQPTKTANSKLKKKGVFKKEWMLLKVFSSWLQQVQNDCKKARCKACLRTFNIHEGKPALRKHMNSEVHKTHTKSFGNNILITRTSFGEAQKVPAMELQ